MAETEEKIKPVKNLKNHAQLHGLIGMGVRDVRFALPFVRSIVCI